MRVQVRKWGNSASITIPASVMAAAELRAGQFVDVRAEGGRLLIELAEPARWDLDALLDGMAPETFPEDVGFGRPTGQEIW